MLPVVTNDLYCELPFLKIFTMPKVVPDQREKFDNDDLFRKLSREAEVCAFYLDNNHIGIILQWVRVYLCVISQQGICLSTHIIFVLYFGYILGYYVVINLFYCCFRYDILDIGTDRTRNEKPCFKMSAGKGTRMWYVYADFIISISQRVILNDFKLSHIYLLSETSKYV